MTAENIRKFIEAMESAGITNYQFLDGMETILYNNSNSSVVIPNYDDEMLIEVRSTIGGRKGVFDGKQFTINCVSFDNVTQARVGFDFKDMEPLAEALGVSLTEDQVKMIGAAGYRMSFVTPDYTFKELTPEQYEELTPEEKEVYDKKKLEKEKQKLGVSQSSGSVTFR